MIDKENIENFDDGQGSRENLESIKTTVIQALQKASAVHESLGESGEELVQQNQFGETSLKADVECEQAVLDFLKETGIPIRVVSEEHGLVDVTENPRYLGILDGLDGTNVYKKERGIGRYGTMFGIFETTNPSYKDYLVSGIIEHSTGKVFIALKNGGAFVTQNGETILIHSSGKTALDKDANIYIDEYFKINKETFSKKLKGFRTRSLGASCAHYTDVASGAADLALECTRKGNLEIAVAYGLEAEAGAVMVDLDGKDIGDKKYLEFGQKEQLPIITASTKELAEDLLKHLKNGR